MTKVIRIGTELSENKVGAINIITDQDVSRSVVGILKNPTGEYALDVSGVIRCSAVQVDASAVNFVYPSQLSQDITGSLSVSQDVSISGDLVVDGTNVKMCNLDISDTGYGQTLITSTGVSGDIIFDVSNSFKISNDTNDILYVDASNQLVEIQRNVGGTALDVSGDFMLRQNLKFAHNANWGILNLQDRDDGDVGNGFRFIFQHANKDEAPDGGEQMRIANDAGTPRVTIGPFIGTDTTKDSTDTLYVNGTTKLDGSVAINKESGLSGLALDVSGSARIDRELYLVQGYGINSTGNTLKIHTRSGSYVETARFYSNSAADDDQRLGVALGGSNPSYPLHIGNSLLSAKFNGRVGIGANPNDTDSGMRTILNGTSYSSSSTNIGYMLEVGHTSRKAYHELGESANFLGRVRIGHEDATENDGTYCLFVDSTGNNEGGHTAAKFVGRTYIDGKDGNVNYDNHPTNPLPNILLYVDGPENSNLNNRGVIPLYVSGYAGRNPNQDAPGFNNSSNSFDNLLADIGSNEKTTIYSGTGKSGTSNGQTLGSGNGDGVSIVSEHAMLGTAFVGRSDERIKKNIVDISDNEALEILRQIQPKKYEYKDVLNKPIGIIYGYIAQQIDEVLPYAVSKFTEYIPNVYNIADVSMNAENKYTLNINNYDTANLDPSSTVLKIFDGCFNEIIVNIDSIVDGSNIVIEEDISYADLHDNRKVFVHGQEVNDFRILNKEAINVITLSSLQELDRQFTQLKQENETLQTELSSIKNRLDALESAT